MKNIMVVDDDPDILFSVVDSLKSISKQYEFYPVSSGKKAIDMLKIEAIDLILLDIMMPHIDGWTIAAKVKGDPKTRNIPILFLTAKTDDLSKGMGSLMSEDYIEKPFDIDDLNQRIIKVLG